MRADGTTILGHKELVLRTYQYAWKVESVFPPLSYSHLFHCENQYLMTQSRLMRDVSGAKRKTFAIYNF